jgi:hypothetical protein
LKPMVFEWWEGDGGERWVFTPTQLHKTQYIVLILQKEKK